MRFAAPFVLFLPFMSLNALSSFQLSNRRVVSTLPFIKSSVGHFPIMQGQKSGDNSDNYENGEDPTKVWYAGIANSIQSILTNS
ncbi:MAG: hypothetical protein ACREBR_01510, partial [bacterium]